MYYKYTQMKRLLYPISMTMNGMWDCKYYNQFHPSQQITANITVNWIEYRSAIELSAKNIAVNSTRGWKCFN